MKTFQQESGGNSLESSHSSTLSHPEEQTAIVWAYERGIFDKFSGRFHVS